MSLRKRGGIWWIDIVAPNGERIRQSTGTANKALAQEFHDRLKSELWRIAKLGERPRRTWNDAVVRWLKESEPQGHDRDGQDASALARSSSRGKQLDDISRATIDRITDAKLAEGVANATVNRTLEVLRAILRKCVNEWEWLDRAPAGADAEGADASDSLPDPRRGANACWHELPPHLADMAAFSLATGLRRSNVTGLQWTQVDLVRRVAWIHPDQAKARKAIAVPLNAEAVAIVRRQDREASDARVQLSRASRFVRSARRLGMKALKRAGIEDFRWHDLRHTWASWHVQNGTPLFALQELGGWESPEMVRRYAHFSAEHLSALRGSPVRFAGCGRLGRRHVYVTVRK